MPLSPPAGMLITIPDEKKFRMVFFCFCTNGAAIFTHTVLFYMVSLMVSLLPAMPPGAVRFSGFRI